MPTVKCDINTINLAAKCLACFSQKENQAALVYFLEQTRAKLAGQTPMTPAALRSTTACLGCIPMDPTCDNLDSAVAQAGAIGVGDSASGASIAAIRKAINPYANMNLDDLRTMEAYLRCQLNAFLFVS